MTIPPFPSQDLAKLVLGYLAEEQLMTAYDEFLQASPYLDAHRNEYDRIFMTSLRNILAEYWAVKIFVESCKPFALRKKLLQCTNLLDAVKFLINHVDIAKIQLLDTSIEKPRHNNSNYNQLPVVSRQSGCEVCMSLNSKGCTCKDDQHNSSVITSRMDNSAASSSVETTPLETLPGNFQTKKNYVNIDQKDLSSANNISLAVSNNLGTIQSSGLSTKVSNGQNGPSYNNFTTQATGEVVGMALPMIKPTVCTEKIEEFNNVLYKVCENKTGGGNKRGHNGTNCTAINYAIAVSAAENQNISGLNYITANNLRCHKEATIFSGNMGIGKEVPKNINDQHTSTANFFEVHSEPKVKDSKIKIISDIKVDSNCATSKSLMQTIRINGTPVYRQKPPPQNGYTSDEIMAMPTLILVPATGPPSTQNTVYQYKPKPIVSQACNQEATKTVSSERILGPLVIDVSSNPTENHPIMSIQQSKNDAGLVKTIDLTKNSSVPKDNTISSVETNTPQVQPPVRKSSSTPRRNSHIRVLDFTAPRRILQETIEEQPPETSPSRQLTKTCTNSQLLTAGADITDSTIIDMSSVTVHKIECPSNIQETLKATDKKKNWDTDLRALLAESEMTSKHVTKKKTKRISKKKATEENCQSSKEEESTAKKIRIKKTPKKKDKRKPKQKDDDDLKIIQDTTKVVVKPNIKVITGDEIQTSVEPKIRDNSIIASNQKAYESSSYDGGKKEIDTNALPGIISENESYIIQDSKKVMNRSHNESNDVNNETPEAERISLQNVIGAKLNIADFLETPYKQALYDIQMETPKFLGHELPDEPISDIKIMSIPTPRFFDTPKPAQATPSSYSSRPTDYSSGGSYYKPDDQDYIPILDIDYPESSKPGPATEPLSDKENDSKKSRPVRKCAKNVSYSLNQNTTNKIKEKESDGKSNVACSNLLSSDTSSTYKTKTKTPQRKKSEINKKKLVSNKQSGKSPIKKSSSFIKIKPRRPTPTKVVRGKPKKSLVSAKTPLKKTNKTSIKMSNTGKSMQNTHINTTSPTKSRRKSSTPRKLHCAKIFHSESSGQGSPEINRMNDKEEVPVKENIEPSPNPITDKLDLHLSEDSNQEFYPKKIVVSNESEDIGKIKEYIQITNHTSTYDPKGSFHKDLIKRGFDAETAKSIERDLLDTPPRSEQLCNVRVEIMQTKSDDTPLLKTVEPNSNSANPVTIDADEEIEEIELSACECGEESSNYIVVSHDYTKETYKGLPIKLKDKFSMEVCIDDGVPIRLRATECKSLFEQSPESDKEIGYSYKETAQAVESISHIDRLYTPLKHPTKDQCYEIFDSTLTSLDTPLKSQKDNEDNITEIQIVIEEEGSEQADSRKRKRLQSNSPNTTGDNKKTKSEAQYLLNSTNIQNIDIESVLTKLHGP